MINSRVINYANFSKGVCRMNKIVKTFMKFFVKAYFKLDKECKWFRIRTKDKYDLCIYRRFYE